LRAACVAAAPKPSVATTATAMNKVERFMRCLSLATWNCGVRADIRGQFQVLDP
jgi:hypothetical protein